MDFIELCRKLISIESTPCTGNFQVVRFLAEVCQSKGFSVELQESVDGGIMQANLIVQPSKIDFVDILFLSHLDTRDPGSYSLWTQTDHNPFSATIRDGRLYGLGSSHAKLDFLCKLSALEQVSRSKIASSFALVGTFGVETGLSGIKHLLNDKKFKPVRGAFVGAPTGLYPVSASCGMSLMELFFPFQEDELRCRAAHLSFENLTTQSRIFNGKPTHSSTPELGENAIESLVRYLRQLPKGIAVLTADGGTSPTVVPEQALLEIDPGQSLKHSVADKIIQVFSEMESIATDFIKFEGKDSKPSYNISLIRTTEEGIRVLVSIHLTPEVPQDLADYWRKRFKMYCAELAVEFKIIDHKAPVQLQIGSTIGKHTEDQLRSMGLPIIWQVSPFANESNILAAREIPTLVIGPGARSHEPNESVALQDLELAKEFYKGMIQRLS